MGDFPIGKVYSRYPAQTDNAGWLYRLYQIFKDTDAYDIHWIIVDKYIKKTETITVENQTFHLAPGTSQTVGMYTGYLLNRWRTAQIVKKIKPDIFHGWGTERFYGLCAKDFKGKSLLSVQGILTAYCQRATIAKFEQKQCFYERIALKGVDYLTTESLWGQERLLEEVPSANVTLWEYAPQEYFFSAKRELSPAPTCLLAGTHSPVKDISTAIRAFSSPKLSHVKLYLAGIKPNSLGNLSSNIIPLGRVPREEIALLLQQSWCLVHPSVADTSPNIVKEARVMGLPAIVTSECGGKQYIKHGQSGYIINPRDVDALIDSVLKITSSAKTSITMGQYDQERCRELLSLNTMKKGLFDIYHRILTSD